MWLSTKEATTRYGIKRQALDKIHDKGHALKRKVGRNNQYDQTSYDDWLGFSLGSTKSQRDKEEPPELPPNNSEDEKPPEDPHVTTLRIINVSIQQEKLKKEKRLNDEADGKLIDRKMTEDFIFEMNRKTRDSMLTIPDRVAGLFLNKTKHEIVQILTEEIKDSLTNLTDEV